MRQPSQESNEAFFTRPPPRNESTFLRRINIVLIVTILRCLSQSFSPLTKSTFPYDNSLLLRPSHPDARRSGMTLRQYLTTSPGFHLAMSPAFFGFYAYFGALITLNEELGVLCFNTTATPHGDRHECPLRSVAGSSAGAMAAVLLAAGIDPRHAAEFASNLSLMDFADFPGLGGFFKGTKFKDLMSSYIEEKASIGDADAVEDFLRGESIGSCGTPRLERSRIPVAVTAFDVLGMKGKILTKGCMAEAARASATFPGLFQPTLWKEEDSAAALLIDGGIADPYGWQGLTSTIPASRTTDQAPVQIVNIAIGSFGKSAPGPSEFLSLAPDLNVKPEVVSISIQNTPRCGPWAMSNGKRAVEASRLAILEVLDEKMFHGKEEGHYELFIDASRILVD